LKINRNELLLKRKGKVGRHDPMVTRGCGGHIPLKFKKKQKQKIKKELKEW
jgi:hypothetical protein